jgi:ubiquinone/menaquinone biosynthesis C-methylase UbiE
MKKYLAGKTDLSSYADVADECCLWSAPFGLKLLDNIRYRSGIVAADIGCGTGFPLIEIAMRLGESSVVYGIDPWKEATARAKKKIDYYKVKNITIIDGYAESIPLEDASVDLITSNNGLNNVIDMNKALSECSRIIKQGGQFVQTFNLDKSMIEFYTAFESTLNELGMKKQVELMHEHIREKRRPPEEITSLMQSKGFIIKNIQYDHFCYRFSDASAMLNHFFIKLAFMPAWISFLPQERVEEIFEKVETRLNERSATNGEFSLSIPFVLINAVKQ